MKLSLAITTYNRHHLTIDSCAQVMNDPRIDDIVIMDDATPNEGFYYLHKYFSQFLHVNAMVQPVNKGMSRNKADAISYAKNACVIIFDSDNVIDPSYIDAFDKITNPDPKTIYCPDWALPDFNFTSLAGQIVTQDNVGQLLRGKFKKELTMSLNCCNYIVNREEYLKVYQHNPEMKAADTIWFAFLWLSAGNKFYIVPGMRYQHRVHAGSGFLEDADYNMKQSEKVVKMIMAL